MANQACQDGILEAFKGLLSKKEINTAFKEAKKASDRIRAQGNLDGFSDKVIADISLKADLARVAAAVQRRHAALNAIVRDRLDNHIDTLMKGGLSHKKAVLAYFEGSQRGVELGRVSIAGLREGYEARYFGQMMAEVDVVVPHARRLIEDKELSDDVVREMMEIGKSGRIGVDGKVGREAKPGRTGNQDAKKIAEVFSKYAEIARMDGNKLGGLTGKLDFWGGPHRHSNSRVAKVTSDVWIDFIKTKLDRERSFPGVDDVEYDRILKEINKEIIQGHSNKLTPDKTGKIVGPSNLTKRMARSRVLHFTDADAWIEYNDLYGDGTMLSGMISHQQRAASINAQMSALGPNPTVMIEAKLAAMRDDLANDTTIAGGKKQGISDQLRLGNTGIGHAFKEMSGTTQSPVDMSMAQISQGIRNIANMTSLGGAVLTAIPTDTITAIAEIMFRGGGFVKGMANLVTETLSPFDLATRRRIAFSIGEGADGISGSVAHAQYVHDGVPGGLSRGTDRFFRYTGLTGWTDYLRAATARVAAREMADLGSMSFSALPNAYKSSLKRHGINANMWAAMRTTNFKADNGVAYTTPDLMQHIADAHLEPMIKKKMADIQAVTKDPKRLATARARLLDEARDDLELSTARFFADSTSFSVVQADAASRRISYQGTQPGTATGEGIRFLMQFKGFPIAFSQRIMGRTAFALTGPDRLSAFAHMGSLITGLGMAGYVSIAMKDFVKGNWPPREMTFDTIRASFLQGGAFGIYGDFLFGQTSRFGGGLLETVAGPVVGRVATVGEMMLKARDGDVSGAQWLNQAIRLTPYNNVWYAKPALDALILNSLREQASPGYRARQERRIRNDFGQEKLF